MASHYNNEKVRVTTVDKVDMTDPNITRVGIVPYFIENGEVWLTFLITSLSTHLIHVGGHVENTDYNLFDALKREISEEVEIGENEFTAEKIAGSLVIIETGRITVLWKLDNRHQVKEKANPEVEAMIYLTQSQFVATDGKTRGGFRLSTSIKPLVSIMSSIGLKSFSPDPKALPLNYDLPLIREPTEIAQKVFLGYDAFLDNFASKKWYIIYIYNIGDFYYIKNQAGEYYMFNLDQFADVLRLTSRKRAISFYSTQNLPVLSTINFRSLPSVLLAFMPERLPDYERELGSPPVFPSNVDKATLERLEDEEAMRRLDLISEYESSIFESHKKTGAIKNTTPYSFFVIGKINEYMLEKGTRQITIKELEKLPVPIFNSRGILELRLPSPALIDKIIKDPTFYGYYLGSPDGYYPEILYLYETKRLKRW